MLEQKKLLDVNQSTLDFPSRETVTSASYQVPEARCLNFTAHDFGQAIQPLRSQFPQLLNGDSSKILRNETTHTMSGNCNCAINISIITITTIAIIIIMLSGLPTASSSHS